MNLHFFIFFFTGGSTFSLIENVENISLSFDCVAEVESKNTPPYDIFVLLLGISTTALEQEQKSNKWKFEIAITIVGQSL